MNSPSFDLVKFSQNSPKYFSSYSAPALYQTMPWNCIYLKWIVAHFCLPFVCNFALLNPYMPNMPPLLAYLLNFWFPLVFCCFFFVFLGGGFERPFWVCKKPFFDNDCFLIYQSWAFRLLDTSKWQLACVTVCHLLLQISAASIIKR